MRRFLFIPNDKKNALRAHCRRLRVIHSPNPRLSSQPLLFIFTPSSTGRSVKNPHPFSWLPRKSVFHFAHYHCALIPHTKTPNFAPKYVRYTSPNYGLIIFFSFWFPKKKNYRITSSTKKEGFQYGAKVPDFDTHKLLKTKPWLDLHETGVEFFQNFYQHSPIRSELC